MSGFAGTTCPGMRSTWMCKCRGHMDVQERPPLRGYNTGYMMVRRCWCSQVEAQRAEPGIVRSPGYAAIDSPRWQARQRKPGAQIASVVTSNSAPDTDNASPLARTTVCVPVVSSRGLGRAPGRERGGPCVKSSVVDGKLNKKK